MSSNQQSVIISTAGSSSSRRSTMLFMYVSSLLFATSSAFQVPNVPPSHTTRGSIRTSRSKLQYTYNVDAPEVTQTPEFQAKMKTLLKPKPKQTKDTTKKGKQVQLPNLKTINSKEELKAAVLEDQDRITVVRFYAPFCQSCKRVEPLFHQFARRNPDIQFIDVPYTKAKSNRLMVHQLGVPSFPYCHVYHPASLGLVEEHSMNQKYFKDVIRQIESYKDGGCDLAPHPNEDGIYGSPYKSLLAKEEEPASASASR